MFLSAACISSASTYRTLTPFQLTRYLDDCSEMLSLCAKIAALYAQDAKDPVVNNAVSELEQLTANLSGKIWQKITIVQSAKGQGNPLTKAEAAVSTPAQSNPMGSP